MMKEQRKNAPRRQAEQRAYKKKRIAVIVTAAVLALAMLVSAVVLTLTHRAAALSFGGATLREDAYAYLFSCYKYEYLAAYKQLGIEDTEEGWQKTTEDGKTYAEAFKAAIDKEIALRFVASVLYDKSGEKLSDATLASLKGVIEEMEEYSYGEDMYAALKDCYGIRRNGLKRIALYEVKYKALLTYLYGGDFSGVFAAEHADDLAAFYREHYTRVSFIYLSDEKNLDTQAAFRAAIAEGLDDVEFSEWEREYSEKSVSENYPNGIYLYDGIRYDGVFSDSLLSAFYSLESEGNMTEVRDDEAGGTYFVRRYALDEKPYLSKDEKVKKSLDGFAEYAARAFYRKELEEYLDDVVTEKAITDAYTLPKVKKEALYNIVNLLK